MPNLPKTLLHHIYETGGREQGWLTVEEAVAGLVLNVMDVPKVRPALDQLVRDGMLEHRNTKARRDEWRIRGTLATPGPGHVYGDAKGPNLRAPRPTRQEAAAAFAEEAMLAADPAGDFSPEGTARTILNHLTGTAPDHDWVRERELTGALNLSLPALWVGLDRLQGAGLVEQRLNKHRAVRLHPGVFRG